MSARSLVGLAALLWLGAAPPAPAQTAALASPAGGQVTLESLSGGDPFAGAAALGAPVPARSAARVNVGFSYLRPYYASDGLALRAPVGTNPAVGTVSPYGNLSENFGFVPRIDLQYDAEALGFAAGTSAQFINLGGSLDRTVTLSGANADLSASNDLTFLIVDVVELTRAFRVGDAFDHPAVEHFGLEEDVWALSLGTRFVSARQDYHATLRGDNVLAASDATQTFAGLGVSAALATDHALSDQWGLYSNTRGSLLVGPNNRKSAASGVDLGGPFQNSLVENKTTVIPAAELELGVRYFAPLRQERAAAEGSVAPVLSVRAGLTAQYWGGLGLLPAARGTEKFDDRSLFLVGFTLLAGVEF